MNTNSAHLPSFFDCPEDYISVIGARVTVDGEEMGLGMPHVRLLQRFQGTARDANNNKIRLSAELTAEQVADFALRRIYFEPADTPGWYYAKSKIEIGKFYRQGY